jgi:hypothetical protein
MAALTTLLTGFRGLDADHAAAAAWIICAVLGGAAMLLAWYLQWKVPSAPPLPFNMRNSVDSPPKDKPI